MSKPTGFKGSRTRFAPHISEAVHFSAYVTDAYTTDTDCADVREIQGPRQPQDTPQFVVWLQERYPLTMLPNFDYTNPAAYMPDWAPNA